MFEWTISVGTLVTLLAILFSGAGFYWRQVYDSQRFRLDINDIKLDLKQLNSVIINLAIQTQKLDSQSERLSYLEKTVDELRHGKGLVQ